MKVTLKGNKLVVELDIDPASDKLSSTGKTFNLGYESIKFNLPTGEQATVNVNCFKKAAK